MTGSVKHSKGPGFGNGDKVRTKTVRLSNKRSITPGLTEATKKKRQSFNQLT
jgi:hypothetical protein